MDLPPYWKGSSKDTLFVSLHHVGVGFSMVEMFESIMLLYITTVNSFTKADLHIISSLLCCQVLFWSELMYVHIFLGKLIKQRPMKIIRQYPV